MRGIPARGAALMAAAGPRALWRRLGLARRLADSPRLRVLRLLWDTSPVLSVLMGLFILADGFLPIVALVALGRAVGRIPAAVTDGLGSASGRSLLTGLIIGTAAYAVSLLRSPAEDLLAARASAVMATGMQRRLAQAVCAPAGVEHLEDSAVLDQLAAASGELSTSGPADAPMALAAPSATGSAGLSPASCSPRSAGISGCCSSPAGRCCGRRCAGCWPNGPR
jgi:hypothetical protein